MAEKAISQYSCPSCGNQLEFEGFISLDETETELLGKLLDGSLNVETCPSCGTASLLQMPIFYHDGEKKLLVAYAPHAGQMSMEELAEAVRIPYEMTVTRAAERWGIIFPEPDDAAFPRGEEHLHSPFSALTQEQAAELLPQYLLNPTIVDGIQVMAAIVQAVRDGLPTQEVLDDMARLQLINAILAAPDALTRRKILHRYEPYLNQALTEVFDTLQAQFEQENNQEMLQKVSFVRGEVDRYNAARETRLKKEHQRQSKKKAGDEPAQDD